MMLRDATAYACSAFGRTISLRLGAEEVTFLGIIKGLRADELVQSAQQGDALLVIPAEGWAGSRAPKKMDKVLANGRQYTVQFVRECWDGEQLCSYKAVIRG